MPIIIRLVLDDLSIIKRVAYLDFLYKAPLMFAKVVVNAKAGSLR